MPKRCLPTYWIVQDGVLLSEVPPANRGLAYGDGLFETMRVQSGRIPFLERHLARLSGDLARLSISMPAIPIPANPMTANPLSGSDLSNFLMQCCAGFDRGVIKLIVTRGGAGRGYLPEEGAAPVCIVSLHPFPHYDTDYGSDGIAIGVASLRLGHSRLLAGMKHLNRLEQVLVRRELAQAGFLEGVVLDEDDLVVEAAFSNICMVSGHDLKTPLLNKAGVAGIMRGWVLEHASYIGLTPSECHLTLSDFLKADEVFLCNSVNGIWPVTRILSQSWSIGQHTRALQNTLKQDWP